MHKEILIDQFGYSKYLRYYLDIIHNAKIQQRSKGKDCYFEKHHVLPSCIYPEYKNLKQHEWNGVLLTPREHFICHYLLCKISKSGSISWIKHNRAFTFMWSSSGHQRRYFNSHLYALARRNIGQIMSEEQSGHKNSQYGSAWMTCIQTKTNFKVPKDQIQSYLEEGYIKGRVINWDNYREQNKPNYKAVDNRNKKKIDKINKLQGQIQDIIAAFEFSPNLVLSEGLEPPTS